ncbi:MAG: phosphoribosylanthranilate isomerase [Flavobacteriales bacterium]|nr:phosphoribosylanthranilate isomerase [Flavobacteriales bacterium]
MKIKVCGMREEENVWAIAEMQPDYLGFIFFEGSKRNIKDTYPTFLNYIDSNITKVGVFVNERTENILDSCRLYNLTMVQLHGNEWPAQCKELMDKGLKIMKAFSVDDNFDFETVNEYKGNVDYFLFDTKGANYGGNGIAFDWDLLKKYDNEVPFFLSGGVDESVLDELDFLKEMNIVGIDVNSKFEVEPGLKDVPRLKEFISKIKQ